MTTTAARKPRSGAKVSGVLTPKDERQTAEAVKEAVLHPVQKELAQVPPMKYFDEYISRLIDGRSEFDIFDFAHLHRLNVLIEGPTGPGKTSAALAWAAKNSKRFYAIPSNVGVEPSQMFGKFIPDSETGGFKWVDGPVTDIVRNGGCLLINEVNFMPERVATVLFSLLDKRRQIMLVDNEGEVIDAHRDLLIMADMNPDYEGTRPLNKAFRNRFGIQLFWDYDAKVEAQLVNADALLKMAKKIRDDSSYDTPVSTNMLMEFERVYYGLGLDFAVANFINHFPSDDREPIKLIVKTFSANVKAELDAYATDYWPDEDKDWNDGDVDPILGAYDVDWAFEDEKQEASV